MDFGQLQSRIRALLKERRAILLVHYYQRPEIQEIADILGDSLALSIEAARTDAEVIVFAGVHFMAESASILSPDKTVLLPRPDAGCPLADMIDIERLEKARREHPGATVVTYVNSTAAVKSCSDFCCTSANARQVVASIEGAGEILMVPDGNLARWVAGSTDRKIIPWEGYCPVHHRLDTETVLRVRDRFPKARFAAHPECRAAVLALADYVGSTSGILKYAASCDSEELIVGTEEGILTQLKKENPGKVFISAAEDFVCEDMKKITLEDIYRTLEQMKPIVKVPDGVRIAARKALDRMIAVS
ncbi:MAG: quinolinate synthase NadA [Deltaproteobacteria bacterium]|nr:quinolinate synthase NadA [Deltaproteobacteria bacterium]